MDPLLRNFRVAVFEEIAHSSGRAVRLDERPGVYAWYRNINLYPKIDSRDAFLTAVQRLVDARLSPLHQGKLGFLYDLSVQEAGGPLSASAQATLEGVAESRDGRAMVASFLKSASLLLAPLYIGKTNNIRRRIGSHIEGRSELGRLLEDNGMSLSDCMVCYRYVEESPLRLDSQETTTEALRSVSLLLEELLTRLGPAAFVRRPG